MTDELEWFLSYTGPRASVTASPDLGSVARAVAVWAYDPDHPREATRVIAELNRHTVALALDAALAENPLLLSPKKRNRVQPLPPAVDMRLTRLARKRIREIYPEIERAERAAELSVRDREHPAVRTIFNGYYEGSGGGRPRGPARYPAMLADVLSGLLELAKASRESNRAELAQLREEAMDCYRLCREVSETCETLRRRGQDLCRELRALATAETDRMAGYEADGIEASLAEGNLPYANSEILPVGPYGMQPKWGLEPLVRQFAKDNQAAYDEIDRYGKIAMEWARRIAVRARDMLPPQIPVAETGGDGTRGILAEDSN